MVPSLHVLRRPANSDIIHSSLPSIGDNSNNHFLGVSLRPILLGGYLRLLVPARLWHPRSPMNQLFLLEYVRHHQAMIIRFPSLRCQMAFPQQVVQPLSPSSPSRPASRPSLIR